MAKGIRVNQLAKELGVDSKDILTKCREEGLGDKIPNHMSVLSQGLAEKVRDWFKKPDRPKVAPEQSKPASDHDWFDPFLQNSVFVQEVLNYVRTLTPHFTQFERELTDGQWTAFKYLASKGMVEGILHWSYTHAVKGPVDEFMRIQGNYTDAMHAGNVIRNDAPLEFNLTEARLTERGEQMSRYLQDENKDPVKSRGFVLSVIEKSEDQPGSATLINPRAHRLPISANSKDHQGPQSSAQPETSSGDFDRTGENLRIDLIEAHIGLALAASRTMHIGLVRTDGPTRVAHGRTIDPTDSAKAEANKRRRAADAAAGLPVGKYGSYSDLVERYGEGNLAAWSRGLPPQTEQERLSYELHFTLVSEAAKKLTDELIDIRKRFYPDYDIADFRDGPEEYSTAIRACVDKFFPPPTIQGLVEIVTNIRRKLSTMNESLASLADKKEIAGSLGYIAWFLDRFDLLNAPHFKQEQASLFEAAASYFRTLQLYLESVFSRKLAFDTPLKQYRPQASVEAAMKKPTEPSSLASQTTITTNNTFHGPAIVGQGNQHIAQGDSSIVGNRVVQRTASTEKKPNWLLKLVTGKVIGVIATIFLLWLLWYLKHKGFDFKAK